MIAGPANLTVARIVGRTKAAHVAGYMARYMARRPVPPAPRMPASPGRPTAGSTVPTLYAQEARRG